MNGTRHRSGGQALAGALLLGIGALLFANNLNLVSARQYWRYWPMLPLVIGIGKLVAGQSRGDRAFGIVLTIVGGSQLARVLGYWSPGPADVTAVSLIGVGIFFIGRGLLGRAEPESSTESSDWMSAFVLMAGLERSNNSQNFRGGDLTAIMGGCEIDLRQASLRAPATIDIFVMWGGVELRVPDDWTVDLQGTPLLGGFGDRTRPPAMATEKRLIIRGVAVMGGVEIKN